MKDIYFQHHYFKLDNFVFPTVRGKSWASIKQDTRVRIIDKELNLTYNAKILENKIRIIEDLSLSFIQLDGTYSDKYGIHVIGNHIEFLNLLNSFRRFNKIESIKEQVSVLWLIKET